MARKGSNDWTVACSVFGGRSQKTGKPVGERHRWEGNQCIWCGKSRNEVLSTDGTIDGIKERRKLLGHQV